MLRSKKKGTSKGKEPKSKAARSKKAGKKSKSKNKASKEDDSGWSQEEPLVVAPASSPESSPPVLRDRSNSLRNNKRDSTAAATGVTFDDSVYDDLKINNERSNDLSYNMRREKSILKKDNSNFNREDVNLHSANSMVTRENTRLNRENTQFPRDRTIKRENTTFERENTKHARFSDRERSDFSLKSRPETSLDGQLVDLVDCTDTEDFPPFNSNAVLRGPAVGSANNNNAKLDPANARKPFFTQNFDNRRKDSIVVWPFGDGTITLPKPPPRQARPPTILESPEYEDKWVRINIGG